MAASNTRFTQKGVGRSKIPLTGITVSTATEAGVHHAAWRGGRGVAARGKGAAAK